MVGMTLREIRGRLESLTSADGEYAVVCARTGVRPIPVEGLRFPDPETAREAAGAAEQYRAALRRYDPQLPTHDLIHCHDPRPGGAGDAEREAAGGARTSTSDTGPAGDRARPLVAFCHRVAAAVFEALDARGHDAVERRVMDAYFELAETVSGPDELCLCLLESMATALDGALSPADQRAVLEGAADRLGTVARADRPLSATLERLERSGILARAGRPAWSTDDTGRRTVALRVREYALSPRAGRLPVLPVVVELFRHRRGRSPAAVTVQSRGDDWELRIELAEGTAPPSALVAAPVDREA